MNTVERVAKVLIGYALLCTSVLVIVSAVAKDPKMFFLVVCFAAIGWVGGLIVRDA
jgi:hypothetical protein